MNRFTGTIICMMTGMLAILSRFQQIHEKLLYSSQNASTFQTERKYILPETQVRLDTNVKAFTSKRTCVFPITSNRTI
jgi:hypothetical protein